MALASMGIYIFSKDFLYKVLYEDAMKLHSSRDFGKDIIPSNIHRAKAIAYPFRNEAGNPGYWRDVGTVYSYWQANMELCSVKPELNLYDRDWPIWTYQPQYPPAKFVFDDEGCRGEAIDSLISTGCILSGARVKRSIVFFANTLEKQTIVKDSVILPKVNIGSHCHIERAIIDKGAVIPSGMTIGKDLELDRKRFHVTDEGIVLVTAEMLGQKLRTGDKDSLWRLAV